MGATHELLVDTDDGTSVVFVCPEDGCGRRVVIDRKRGNYTVIDRGDFFATHSGSVGPITVRLASR